MPDKLPVPHLSDAEIDELQALLESLPAPLDPPDLSALDGYLVGVLLQPVAVPNTQWQAFLHDFDGGRPAPPGVDLTRLHGLVRRRHAELDAAIAARRWFDPWVFELEAGDPGEPLSPSQTVLPWVAGCAAALERFPLLLERAGAEAREPLAVLYAHFDPEDLEDVDDELIELIDEIAPPDTLEEAVETLVRSTLLLADAMKSRPAPTARRGRRPRR
jgi:uncharacterized protein